MNRICNWIVDHKHYSHLPKQMYEVLNWPFYTASEFLNSFAWLQLQLQWPSIQPSTYNLKSTATPFLDALDVGEWVKQSVTNSFFRDFSFKIRMNYVSSYLRSCLSKLFISINVFPINYGGIHIFIIWILLHVGHFLMCRLYWNSSKVLLSFTPFFLLAFIQLI